MKKKRLLTDRTAGEPFIEDEVTKHLGEEMQKEIDRNVLFDLMTIDWHTVKLPRFVDNNHAIDIQYWLRDNVKNNKDWLQNGATFAFRNDKDAMWFKLVWLS